MSETVKEKSLGIMDEENDFRGALWEDIMSRLQLDGFIWVNNIFKSPPVLEISNKNALESSGEPNPKNVNIAQYDTNKESNENAEECRLECNINVDMDSITPPDWEKGLIVDQQYWEQYGSVVKSESSSKPKYPTSQRLTVKEHDIIDYGKRRNRDPSYYKFDYPTTFVLKTLSEQKHAGPYHNVVARGKNSVVIYAEYPKVPWTRGSRTRSSYNGVAVKVYKLSNDVDRNNAIFKHVHREYTHLLHLKHKTWNIPTVVHKMKNVIITGFIGENQEPAPSLSIVPPEYCRDLYQHITKEMEKWYKKLDLVHGNLCTNNVIVIRYNDGYYGLRHIPFVLGWSRSVRTNHPRALVKLIRDCQYITNFFKMKEVPVMSTEELFKSITGLCEIDRKVLDAIKVIHKKDCWQENHLTNPNREN